MKMLLLKRCYQNVVIIMSLLDKLDNIQNSRIGNTEDRPNRYYRNNI